MPFAVVSRNFHKRPPMFVSMDQAAIPQSSIAAERADTPALPPTFWQSPTHAAVPKGTGHVLLMLTRPPFRIRRVAFFICGVFLCFDGCERPVIYVSPYTRLGLVLYSIGWFTSCYLLNGGKNQLGAEFRNTREGNFVRQVRVRLLIID